MDDMLAATKKRDPALQQLVQETIQEVKGGKADKKRKAEIFDDDDLDDDAGPRSPVHNEGPVKEGLLAEMHQRRRLAKDGRTADANALQDLAADGLDNAEEGDADYERLDGEEVTGFNLRDEEADGFDAENGTLRRQAQEDVDPWLESLQVEKAEAVEADDGRVHAKVRREQVMVSESARAAIRRREAAALAAAPLGDDELNAARRTLLRHLHARESVMDALQRLSGHGAQRSHRSQQRTGRRAGLVLSGQDSQGSDGGDTARREGARGRRDSAAAAVIEEVTDAASSLLSVEADIFEQRREEIDHVLRMATLAGPCAAAGQGGRLPGDQDVEDMFADSADEGENAPRPSEQPGGAHAAVVGDSDGAVATDLLGSGGVTSAPQGCDAGAGRVPAGSAIAASIPVGQKMGVARSAGAAGSGTSKQHESAVDYSGWPVGEMRRVLTEAGVALDGVREKGELVEELYELDRARASDVVPAGFILDPQSGYFFHPEIGWYYHAESQCFYRNGTWYTRDQFHKAS